MLARQRHDIILDIISREGSMRVRDLAERLDVSEMTVRRDLDQLAGLNLLQKVHGGATRLGNVGSVEPGFTEKQHRQREEKDAIAADALSLVQPGSVIGLTAGTTTWALAKLLPTFVGTLTVVTNAPMIAQTLYTASGPDLTVVLTGGIRTPSDALVGSVATSALSLLNVDVLFMGVHGMDADAGFSTPNMAEADTNARFVDAASRVVVVADHTKWGTRGLARIAPLARADVVVSDDGLPEAARATFAALDTELRIVEPSALDHREGVQAQRGA